MKIRSPDDPSQMKLPSLQDTLQQQQRMAHESQRQFPFNLTAASLLSNPLYSQLNQNPQVNNIFINTKKKHF